MSVESATLAELERLGVKDRPEGEAALALARAVDTGTSLMAVPAMVKELRATLTTLRDEAPKAKDGIDDIAARRARRIASAGQPPAADPVGPAVQEQ